MHIPDGFLSVPAWGSLWGLSAATVGYAVRKAGGAEDDRRIPLLGVTAAFVFAAQMVNFPVGGGTSGHFMGGVLAAVLLGPASGLLVMTAVLVIQCFVFQDGGLTALGANICNMGIVGSVIGYWVYRSVLAVVPRAAKGRTLAAAFVASWLSMVLAASSCALELALSGVVPLKVVLAAMAGVHALIGIGEGIITAAALGFIARVRPDLLALKKV